MKKILLALLMLGILQANTEEIDDKKLQTKCDKGDYKECFTLGFLYANGHGVKQDYFKAKEFYGKACDLKDEFGCKKYAELNQKGY